MSNQEAFDKLWRHFVTDRGPQGKGAEDKRCWYRGPEGVRCAIGVLIPDEDYNSLFENWGLDAIQRKAPSLQSIDLGFLIEAQWIHDGWSGTDFHSHMKEGLRSLAKAFHLRINEEAPAG